MSNRIRYVVQLLFVLLGLSLWSGSSRAADEVKLLKVNSIYSTYRAPWLRGSFEVLVANLAYAKRVHIHYRKNTGPWGDYPLTYNRPASGGKEVWSASFNSLDSASALVDPADPIEFVVRYQVNGLTYWDNNNGSNYRINRDGGTILTDGNVYNASYTPAVSNTNGVQGYVTLRNIAPTKQVTVVYTLNNWATVNETAATYNPYFWNSNFSSVTNPNRYGFEEWNYVIPVGNTATQLQYAIRYSVNGATYWDNNFQRNYVTTIAR